MKLSDLTLFLQNQVELLRTIATSRLCRAMRAEHALSVVAQGHLADIEVKLAHARQHHDRELANIEERLLAARLQEQQEVARHNELIKLLQSTARDVFMGAMGRHGAPRGAPRRPKSTAKTAAKGRR